MAAKPLPPQELLLQLLCYEPDTGQLFWNKRIPEHFENGKRTATHRCANWNSKHAGFEAFTATTTGYRYGAINGVNYLAHRLIWKLAHGVDPEEVDHINGDRQDNRLENLRAISKAENQRNMKLPENSTSGAIGVSWDQSRSLWEAHITLQNRKKHLGRFDSFDAAVAARRAAEVDHNFHENHGRA